MKTLFTKFESWLFPKAEVLSPAEEWERSFVVTADDARLVCQFAEGPESTIRWAELEEVLIVTTDEGPYWADVFWVFRGVNGFVEFPLGASGEAAAADRATKLPGFDHVQMTKAMRSTDNARFVVWRRPPPD